MSLKNPEEQALIDSIPFYFPCLNEIDSDLPNTGYYVDDGQITSLFFYEVESVGTKLSLFQSLRHVKTIKIVSCRGFQDVFSSFIFMQNLETLILVDNALSQIPLGVLNLFSLENLTITFDRPTSIPTYIVNLKSLKRLSLRNVLFDSLVHLSDLDKLISLDLSEIHEKTGELGFGLKNLESLTLSGISDYNILNSVIYHSDLKSLKHLSLSHNGLKAVPEQVFRLSLLETLDLSENEIHDVSNLFYNLKNLTRLDISNNLISILPPNVFDLARLCEFNARKNQIWLINGCFGHSTRFSLKKIDLEDNLLVEFPPDLTFFPNLRELNLGFNQIRRVPVEIKNLQNLEIISLEGNPLTELPLEFGELMSLVEINLQNNKFEEIPDLVFKLTRLNTLKIGSNCFSYLPNFISTMVNLQVLWIDNPCKVFFPQSLGSMRHLRELIIGNIADAENYWVYKDNAIQELFARIRDWSPNRIIEKIQSNSDLDYFDLWINELGANVQFINEKIGNIDNNSRRKWDQFIATYQIPASIEKNISSSLLL